MIYLHCQGRLVREPELKTINTGSEVCNFTLAIDRYMGKDKEKETDFLDFQAWGKLGAFVSQYYKKGDGMVVNNAELRSRSYEDKEGKKRTTWEATLINLEFPMGRRNGSEPGREETVPAEQFEQLTADGGLPF